MHCDFLFIVWMHGLLFNTGFQSKHITWHATLCDPEQRPSLLEFQTSPKVFKSARNHTFSRETMPVPRIG
jgi:hypothetical protein